MPKQLALKLLLITLLPLTACKTWYKPGADEDELIADQQRCEDETGLPEGSGFMDCMQRAGWQQSDISATVIDTGDATPTDQPDSNSKTRATGAVSADTHPANVLPGVPDKPSQQNKVGGWSQFGADTEQLESDQLQCRQHDADKRMFNQCMQRKGWHPVGIRISTDEPDTQD